jgi:hypothetical protein
MAEKSLLESLKKPWATEILSLYGYDTKKILRWCDFRDEIVINDKLMGDHLKKLCEIGILTKKEGGYAYSKEYTLDYIFKSQDMELIQNCPIESMYSNIIPYTKIEGIPIKIRCISFYGLKKRNPDIENIIEPVLEKLCFYVDSMYQDILKNIIDNECKVIKNKYFIKLIRTWHKELYKNIMLFLPMQIQNKKIPDYVKCKVPEKYEKEFKLITERIWAQFSQECQPFGVMFRF